MQWGTSYWEMILLQPENSLWKKIQEKYYYNDKTWCFFHRERNMLPYKKTSKESMFEIKTFPSLSIPKLRQKMTCPLSVLHTKSVVGLQYRHTGHSVSVQWLWVTLCTMKCKCACVWMCVWVCVCVNATDKRWSLPEINCLMTLLNIRQHRHLK